MQHMSGPFLLPPNRLYSRFRFAMAGAARISKSAVDWAKFAKLVPQEESGLFATLKGKVDANVTRVASLPEALPKIDFAKYKSAVPVHAAVIDDFAAQYAKVAVPYPKDGGKVQPPLLLLPIKVGWSRGAAEGGDRSGDEGAGGGE